MNIAVIFAGGVGKRMNSRTRPKQFLELHGKPILVYTLEHFQKHKQIDSIVLICLEEWHEYCKALLEHYRMTKVTAVVAGGETCQQSIYNGLYKASELYPSDSIVLIHDGVRPLINEETITNAINCVKKHGSAVTTSSVVETVTLGNRDEKIAGIVDRSKCRVARAPQGFYLGEIMEAHRRARREGLAEFIDSASLMHHYGHELFMVSGPEENIKITMPTDFYIFRAIVDAQESSQIFGI